MKTYSSHFQLNKLCVTQKFFKQIRLSLTVEFKQAYFNHQMEDLWKACAGLDAEPVANIIKPLEDVGKVMFKCVKRHGNQHIIA